MWSVVDTEVIHALTYRTSGADKPVVRTLEFTMVVYRSEYTCACFVVTSDLQGRERAKANRLLGEVVAEELAKLVAWGTIPTVDFYCLCGDFYDYPDLHARGGTGEVSSVLNAFGASRVPVLAVAGNHDLIEEPLDSTVTLLDGAIVECAGMRTGGVGGIVGNPERNQRKTDKAFVEALQAVLLELPHLVLLHQGPEGPTERHKGWGELNSELTLHSGMLVCFGHTQWPEAFYEESENLYCNVDSRVLVFVSAANSTPSLRPKDARRVRSTM
ncbi:MAG: metallophosphoesterase [Armatimonas sp.]